MDILGCGSKRSSTNLTLRKPKYISAEERSCGVIVGELSDAIFLH